MDPGRELPRDLAAVLDACLAPDPGGRPSLAEVALVLDDHAPDQ